MKRIQAISRSAEMYEKLSFTVLMKARYDHAFFLQQVMVDLWSKHAAEKRFDKEVVNTRKSMDYYRSKHQEDVRKLLQLSQMADNTIRKQQHFTLWAKQYRSEENIKTLRNYRMAVRRN